MDPQEIQNMVDEFVAKFAAADMAEEALDDLVHEFKGNEAANINNEGIASQLQYIIGECIGEDGARETLDEMLKGR
jgi:hypothetical protein